LSFPRLADRVPDLLRFVWAQANAELFPERFPLWQLWSSDSLGHMKVFLLPEMY
jgi:hypothetical protein